PAATCCAAPGPTTTISTLTPFRLNHPNSLAMYSGHCSAPLLTKPSMILVSACAGCGEPARTPTLPVDSENASVLQHGAKARPNAAGTGESGRIAGGVRGMAEVSPINEAIENLVAANRILAMERVLDAFGHISVRHPARNDRYFMSRSIAPAQVSAADIVEHTMENEAAHAKDRAAKLYYERWIHGEVYKARPDVGAIVHSHSPTVVPFASTKAPLRPLLHNACFLGFG